MDSMDVDMAEVEEAEGGMEEMDWIETPAYWKGWGAAGGGAKTAVTVSVVIDTNVLVERESLDKLGRLISTCEGGEGMARGPASDGRLAVCVPWTVLCELDGLKKESGTGGGPGAKAMQARLAMRFLEEAFTRLEGGGTSPRHRVTFEGQSLPEFRDATKAFGVSGARHSNDDLILQCTLQKKAMLDAAGAGEAVLLTGDRNLCLKSRACGIRALSSIDALAAQLDALFADLARRAQAEAAEGKGKGNRGSAAPRGPALAPRDDLDAATRERIAREVLDAAREALSSFVEASFRENFGEREWRSMVAIPPPWSPSDVYELVSHHWFSLDLGRDAQSSIDLIKHVHERMEGRGERDRQEKDGDVLPKQTFLMLLDRATDLVHKQLGAKAASTALDESKEIMTRLRRQVYHN